MRLLTAGGAGLLGGLCALALGCGSGGSSLLAQPQAAGLKETLGEVRAAVDERSCSKASARLRQLRGEVGDLGGGVDLELRKRLREEINGKLSPAVTKQCDDPVEVVVPTTTTPAPTGPSGPTEPEPEPETTSTQTETTPPTQTSDTVPVPTVPAPDETTPTVPDPTDDPGGANPDEPAPGETP